MSSNRGELKIEIPSMASMEDAKVYRLQYHAAQLAFNVADEMKVRSTSNYAFLRDKQNVICGGAYITFTADLFIIESIWISTELRGHGHGSRLYQALEDLAYIKNKKTAMLSTFEFQNARSFWERLGFKEFGKLPGSQAGSNLVFMSKTIETENRAGKLKTADK